MVVGQGETGTGTAIERDGHDEGPVHRASDEVVGDGVGRRGQHGVHAEDRGQQQRLGEQHPAGFLEDHGEHGDAEALTPAGLRHGEGADLHLVVEQRPELGRPAVG